MKNPKARRRMTTKTRIIRRPARPWAADKKFGYLGSGCGSVGRAVASETRDQRFELSHWQTLYYLNIVDCIEKMKNKEKKQGMAHFKI